MLDLLLTVKLLAALATAVLAALLLHFLLFKVIQRSSRPRDSFTTQTITRQTFGALRAMLIVVCISIALSIRSVPLWLSGPLRHAIGIAYIVIFAWLSYGAIEAINTLVRQRLPENLQESVQARRTRTQIHLLRRIGVGLTLFGAFAAVLMTFPQIRSIGAGLFASAGLAGLALGMAARPTLGNLIAGVQVALTEPIRIGDIVVVKGEWGQVREVNTTYVIIRLWDLRHQIVPLSYFIEQPFENWTRYSSDLIGSVLIYADYSVPVEKLREEYARILQTSPLWDGKVMTVQVTDAKEHSIEVRFLMSASNPTATFELRCYIREKLVAYLQKQHPSVLPVIRLNDAATGRSPDQS